MSVIKAITPLPYIEAKKLYPTSDMKRTLYPSILLLLCAIYMFAVFNFNHDEVEAIVVGLNLLSRTGDVGLQKAAGRVIEKIESLPDVKNVVHTGTTQEWATIVIATIARSCAFSQSVASLASVGR